MQEGLLPDVDLEDVEVEPYLENVKEEKFGHFHCALDLVVHQVFPPHLGEPCEQPLPREDPGSHEEDHEDDHGVVEGHVEVGQRDRQREQLEFRLVHDFLGQLGLRIALLLLFY